ncbi:MAG: PLP-dependent transferase [Clostridium sp.]|nr:PLP-dependent transferase [Clostridium sp.]
MTTPIADFLRAYSASGTSRLHMPGHKGIGPLGCEHLDITEVHGADALYEAEGIISQSEANAAVLFGSGRTVFSTEGSSQCIRAMLYLALTNRPEGAKPVVVTARNVHKAFVYAAALLDLEVVWLAPEGDARSLCSCSITAETLERTLSGMDAPPCAVYVTSPDYLGGRADIAALAQVCHAHGTVLAVDNAHGAYLHFLPEPTHPLDLGADICCDSAHKTLNVLTGGAYLHISKNAPRGFAKNAKSAMALFGSTSPSYLIMASLDLCNRYLAENFSTQLTVCVEKLDALRRKLTQHGWQVEDTDPLRITINAPAGVTGLALADRLRGHGVECEYADPEFLVFMATPSNTQEDFDRVVNALGINTAPAAVRAPLPVAIGEQAVSIRQALFSPHETIPVSEGLGRICASPTVSCPPAIPIAVSGEVIGKEAMALFHHYGVETLDVLL